MGKALDRWAAEVVGLECQIEHLKMEIESLKPQAKRKAKRTNQEAFYNIEDIKKARDKARAAQPALVARKKAKIAADLAEELAEGSSGSDEEL